MTQRQSQARRWVSVCAASAAVLLVSGCGLVGIRIAEEPGAPLRVGAQATMGPDPEPTETADPALQNHSLEHVTFDETCPARIAIPIPNGWTGNATSTSYFAQPSDSGFTGPQMRINCYDSFGDSPSDTTATSQQHQFTDPATSVTAEQLGQTGPGYFWTYEAHLGAGEIFAEEEPTTEVGSVIGYPIAGKVYKIQVAYIFPTDDSDSRDLATASVGNVSIEGNDVGAPPWPKTN